MFGVLVFMKYLKEFLEKFALMEAFSTRDVKIFLKSRGASENYVSVFLNNLVKQGKIAQIAHGKYAFFAQIDAVEKVIFPSYHGLQDALSLLGLWGQQTIPIIITPLRIRIGERQIASGKVLVKRINRKMFFGYETIIQGDFWLTVSGPEKTLIDFAYYGEPLDKQVLGKLKKKIDKKKLAIYLKEVSPRTRKKVRQRFGI